MHDLGSGGRGASQIFLWGEGVGGKKGAGTTHFSKVPIQDGSQKGQFAVSS